MKSLIIIPARYGSTRFPGKPLAQIAGQSMLSRVIHVAKRVGQSARAEVIVATDHQEILTHAEARDVRAVMTSPDLASGTDRALAAINVIGSDADFIVNLQGDAPFTPPQHIEALIKAGETSDADVTTIVVPLSWEKLDALRASKQQTPFTGTSCIRRPDGQALWFSKTILPAIRKENQLRADSPLSPVLQHIGLYGYKRSALSRFASLPVGQYEALEGLEQLRFLENGMSIHAEIVEAPAFSSAGIDSPSDVERVEREIALYGDPHL